MTSAIAITPAMDACGLQPEAETRRPRPLADGFGCVYLTSSTREAAQADDLMKPVHIRIYHAGSLGDAKARLQLTGSRVLLTDTIFKEGTWKAALEMVARLRPFRSLVVAAQMADDRLWLATLELGAYDLIQKPFRADELRRILENAHSHSIIGEPLYLTA
jgi:DNA-binding NtrC family response regulator